MLFTSLLPFTFLLAVPVLCAPAVFCAPTSSAVAPARPSPRPLSLSATLSGLGTVQPLAVGNAVRYTLPYAEAPIGNLRFANPQRLRALPNNYNAAVQAPACMQSDDGGDYSEDCLFMDVYIPSGATPSSSLPILIWIPGGSFISGSARDAGLDGSLLAAEQNVIVVVLQYRLGVFGWLQSGATLDERRGGAAGASTVAGNQAVRDVVTALSFIQQYASSLGGDSSKVTVSGQSSGAHMVRGLLGTGAADGLFSQAILVSDPVDYGSSTPTTQNQLGEYALQQLQCSTIACARAASVEDLLDASAAAFSNLPGTQDAIPIGEPWRPMVGSYINRDVQKTPSAGPKRKILVTTVSNEAGPTVGLNFQHTAPGAELLSLTWAPDTSMPLVGAASIFFNGGRGVALASSPTYAPTNATVGSPDGLRTLLEGMATDGYWRCASQRLALDLGNAGHTVYLAEHHQGYTYPSNTRVDYCTAPPGKVCHQDDIYLIFGTQPSDASSAEAASSRELRARWGAFIKGRTPNAAGYPTWRNVRSDTNLNLLNLGINSDGSSSIAAQQRLEACRMWGNSVQYDWQMYG